MKISQIIPPKFNRSGKLVQRLINLCNQHAQRVGKNIFGVEYPNGKDIVTLSMKK